MSLWLLLLLVSAYLLSHAVAVHQVLLVKAEIVPVQHKTDLDFEGSSWHPKVFVELLGEAWLCLLEPLFIFRRE